MLRNKDCLAARIFIALFLYKIIKNENEFVLFSLCLYFFVITSVITANIDHWHLWAGIASCI